MTASAASLFADLVELEPEARRERLDQLERSDAVLAGVVREMLAADASGAGPLERLRDEVATAASERLLGAAATPPFERLGAWRLLERLGAGGMGEVWAGEREDGGFAQRAAIKLVRAGFASEAVVARFELERQVLARLEHPAIARVLDGGVAPDGRPWFAMELVEGVPITEHARARELSLERRLRLMIEVCSAVDAAHRSLVVHRDLKPSNILVTAEGRPKLLDFGLAKLLEPELDPRLTRTEMRALTPAYAAPEQVLGEPVTTATDVWALGVVLYELVTGRLPHRREARSGPALEREIERETIEGPAAAIRRDPAAAPAWPHHLSRDLDTIVLQALRREPARRYPTAVALGADLERLLDGRPISARSDSVGYRAAKFARRHRVAVASAVFVLLALVGGLVAALISARRAEREARRALEVQGFLVDLFEAADPERALGAEITARQLLDAGVAELERGLTGEPEVQAALFDTVAQIERRIGRYDSAERLARVAIERRTASFGADALETAEARLTLAEVLFSQGEVEPAGEQFRTAHAALERARDARPEVLVRAGLGLAEAELYLGNNQRALEISERVLARALEAWGEEHATTASALLLHGQLLDPAGRYTEAVAEIERATAILERKLGPDHPRTSEARLGLAEFVGYLGDRPRAHRLFEQTTASLRRTLGDRHALLAQSLVKHALVWINDARPDEAERALAEALEIFSALDHFEAASCERLLGHTLLSRGRTAEAAARFASAYEKFRARLGEEHAYTLTALGNLGTARVRLGEHESAVGVLERAIAGIERLEGVESDDLRQPLLSIGEAERARGNLEAALAHHRRALAIAEARVGPRHAGAANARRELAFDLAATGTVAEALAEFERALEIRREADGASVRLADWLDEAALLAERAGDPTRAGAWREEAAGIREKAPSE